MNTNRLSKKMEKLLNQQITNEAQASQLYLSLAIWADGESYTGVSNLLFRHSQEERDHMMKVIQYILSRSGNAVISSLEAPKMKVTSLKDCFEKVYKHERNNSKAIDTIATTAMEEKDWATWNFAQWFVKEQIEEENLAVDLLDKFTLADKRNESLFELDRNVGNMKDEADLARDADSEHP